MGILAWVPMMNAWLAEGLLHAGSSTAAIAAVEEGFDMSEARTLLDAASCHRFTP